MRGKSHQPPRGVRPGRRLLVAPYAERSTATEVCGVSVRPHPQASGATPIYIAHPHLSPPPKKRNKGGAHAALRLYFDYRIVGLKPYFLGLVTSALDIDAVTGVDYAYALQVVVLYIGGTVIVDAYVFHSGDLAYLQRAYYRIACYYLIFGRCRKVGDV